MLSMAAICADTAEEAAHAASSVQQWRASGLRGPIPAPTTAESSSKNDNALRVMYQAAKPLLYGTADYVKSELDELGAGYDTDEVLLVTITHDHEARLRSYQLLAEAYDLTG